MQTGGPSGGCIPAEHLDEPVDFDRLGELGSMMGSGGMIVMDEDTCMVNIARYFLRFLKDESCGKCTPCREGIAQMLHILDGIAGGRGRPGDIERLEELAGLLEDTALCALGKTAANPVLSTLRYFRDEYQAHIEEKHCPAKECRGLFRYKIEAEPAPAAACAGRSVRWKPSPARRRSRTSSTGTNAPVAALVSTCAGSGRLERCKRREPERSGASQCPQSPSTTKPVRPRSARRSWRSPAATTCGSPRCATTLRWNPMRRAACAWWRSDRGGWLADGHGLQLPGAARSARCDVSSERAVRARQGVMRLLLARAPDSPELGKSLAARMGVHVRGLSHGDRGGGQLHPLRPVRAGLRRADRDRRRFRSPAAASSARCRRRSTSLRTTASFAARCAAVCPVGTIELEVRGEEVELVPLRHQGPGAPLCRLRRSVGGRTGPSGSAAAGGQPLREILTVRELCCALQENQAGRQVCTRPAGPSHAR